MEELVAPYQIAKKLSILGFNDPCIGCFRNGKFMLRIGSKNSKLSSFKDGKLVKIDSEYIAAPTYHQVVVWLYENYKVWVSVNPGFDGLFDWGCYHEDYNDNDEPVESDLFSDPTTVLTLGINVVLNDIESGKLKRINTK